MSEPHQIVNVKYLLSSKEIEEIVRLTVAEAYSGEHMDMPVLWLKINRLIAGTETVLP